MRRHALAGRNLSRRALLMITLIGLVLPAAVAGAAAGASATAAPAGAGHDFLLRFPAVSGDHVAFVAGGDIWLGSARGGVANRLTINDGQEFRPRFSPDGARIAFTGEYDGNADVYVMDVHGGNITRVTFHPGPDQVLGWDAARNKILFSSARDSWGNYERLYLVGPDGTGLETLPLPEASQGSFSPDGRKIAYCKASVDERTWKRYRGGRAPDIFIYDFDTKQERNITNSPAIDSNPMWIGDKVYFTSDRDRVLNIWACDVKSGRLEQLTKYTAAEYDARRPSTDGRRIVYELGGDIGALEVATGSAARLPIEVRADTPELRPYLKTVDEYVTGGDCSPDGRTALLVARGEIFTVPRREGITRNLTRSSGARDKDAVWSPDGARIAFFSDRDGEWNLYVADAAGRGEPERLTGFKDGYRHAPRWSPDGRMIAFTDHALTLSYLDVATRKITAVDRADFQNVDVSLDLKDIHDFDWSPDSRFLAYVKMDESLVEKIHLYALETGQRRCISDGAFNDFNPVFSPDGEHLFFVSNRRFDPTFCDFEWEMVYKKMAGIYCWTLRKNGAPLFPLVPAANGAAADAAAKDGAGRTAASTGAAGRTAAGRTAAAGPPPVVVDFDGLAQRVETLPLPRGNYRSLAVSGDTLFYLDSDEGDYNRFEFREIGPRDLHAFALKDKADRVVLAGVRAYWLSGGGSTILYRQGDELGMVDAGAGEAEGKALDLAGLTMAFEPLAEWRQMFNETWRYERDFYYEPALHGLDWPAMRVKYGRMLERATCRQDVQYIIGELIGELNTSHTYIFGGDVRRKAERVPVGLLGADYVLDPASRRYRFSRIYGDVDWNSTQRPPLVGAGIAVQAGDYLLQVNGADVSADRSVYSYFVGLADKPVELVVNDRPTMAGARTVVVKPVRDESGLRYFDWVEGNRRLVDRASGGTVGYIHFPDTYTASTDVFPRYFYSQTTKKGIIVDGRYNGGGLDPAIFLHRLANRPLMYWTRRTTHDYATPWLGTNAELVCLTNWMAGSGGDMLPFEFRQMGLGPVIGTRSWGGLVGVSMWIGLVDGGAVSAPDYRAYDTAGRWVIENEGVAPDIEVDLDPADFGTGRDAQLSKALDVLLKKIQAAPRNWPQHPAFPVDR